MWQELFGIGFMGTVILTVYLVGQNRKLNKENKKFSNLQLQINNLYGPLYHLVLENENTINLYNEYHKEYNKRFIQGNWSQEKDTQEILQKEASALIEIGNNLINTFVISNNKKIIDLVNQHSACIDYDDQDIFIEFKQHHERLNTEFGDGKLKMPYAIYKNLGNVSYFLPAFAERIKEKYNKKIREFDSLLNK